MFTIIYIQEGQRRIPIQYASRVRGRRMYQVARRSCPCGEPRRRHPDHLRDQHPGLPGPARRVPPLLRGGGRRGTSRTRSGPSCRRRSIQYSILYFLLTVGFTYLYTAFTFKPDETAEQLRKNGGFIPGIRPGKPTQEYLGRVVSRITLAGALFLGTVAVAPVLAGVLDPNLQGIAIGGTGLLIVVSVVVETMKQIEAHDDAQLRRVHPLVRGDRSTDRR